MPDPTLPARLRSPLDKPAERVSVSLQQRPRNRDFAGPTRFDISEPDITAQPALGFDGRIQLARREDLKTRNIAPGSARSPEKPESAIHTFGDKKITQNQQNASTSLGRHYPVHRLRKRLGSLPPRERLNRLEQKRSEPIELPPAPHR